MEVKVCCWCNKEFSKSHNISKKQWMGRKYCSRKCMGNATKGVPLSKEHKRKISEAKKGIPMSEEIRHKISESQRGKKHSEKTKRKLSELNSGKKQSGETKQKISNNKKGKCGEKASAWKGGISFLPYCIKFNNELKERIRNRDNRTCQLCGEIEEGEKLCVHHIHYDKENCYPDLISLCRSCNSKVNSNRDCWEDFFMKILKYRELLN